MKRNRLKREFCAFLALFYVCAVCAGCGKDTDQTAGGADGENAGQEVNLVWVYFSAYGDIAEETVQELNRLLKEKYHCNFTVTPEPVGLEEARDVTDYKRLIRERYEANEATDILYAGSSYVGEMPAYDQAVQDGLLLPLTSLLTETESGQRLYGSFSTAYWTTMQYGGDIYGYRTADEQLVFDSVCMGNSLYVQGLSEGLLEGEAFSLADIRTALEELSKREDLPAGVCALYIEPTSLCSLEGYVPVCYGFHGLYFVEENGRFRAVSAADEERLIQDFRLIRECRELSGDISEDPYSRFLDGRFIFAVTYCNLRNLYDGRYLLDTNVLDVEVLASKPQAAIYAHRFGRSRHFRLPDRSDNAPPRFHTSTGSTAPAGWQQDLKTPSLLRDAPTRTQSRSRHSVHRSPPAAWRRALRRPRHSYQASTPKTEGWEPVR